MAGDASALNVTLSADLKRLEKDLKQAGVIAGKSVADIEDRFAKARPQLNVGIAGAAAGGFVIGALSQAASDLVSRLQDAHKALVDLKEVADRSGSSTDRIQGIQFAGQLQGISSSDTLKAYDQIGRAIDKATQSETEFGRLLAANGVHIRDSKGEVISTSDAFDKMANLVANASGKTGYFKEQILEAAGVSKEMVPLFEQGAEAIRQQSVKAQELGAILGTDIVDKASEFNDRWNEATTLFGTAFKGVLVEIEDGLLKVIGIADRFVGLIQPILDVLNRVSQVKGIAGLTPSNSLDEVNKILDLLGAPAAEPKPLTIHAKPSGPPTKRAPPKASTSSAGKTDEEKRYDQVQRYIDQLEKTGRVLQAEKDSIGLSNAERAKAIELARIGNVTDTDQLAKINAQVDANERLRAELEAIKRARQGISDAANFFGNETIDVFDQMIFKGAEAADVMRSLASTIVKASLQATLLGQGPLAGLFGTSPTSGNSLGGLLGSIFGRRATGGPVQSGKTYLVGENGPEMVRFGQNGTVIPNAAVAGGNNGSGMNVTVINQAGAQIETKQTNGPNGPGVEVYVTQAIMKDLDQRGPVSRMLEKRGFRR